jgi:hypothetical protein
MKKTPPPLHPAHRWALSLAAFVRREALVTLLLAAAVGTGAMIYGAARGERAPETLTVAAEPLTAEKVASWDTATRALAAARDEGRLALACSSLPGFLAWGAEHPQDLQAALPEMPARSYLGVSLAIHQARLLLARRIEHEKRLEAESRAFSEEDLMRLGAPIPEPPAMTDREGRDLEVYDAHFGMVEEALFRLMPAIDYPFEEAEEIQAAPPEGAAGERIAWRRVNPSRFGPRVLRVR